MSALLADVDATCASLGYNDGNVYHPEADAVQGLKVSNCTCYEFEKQLHYQFFLYTSILFGFCVVMERRTNTVAIWVAVRCCKPIFCPC